MADNYEKVNWLWLYQSSSDSNEWLPYSNDVSNELTENCNQKPFIDIIKKHNLFYEFDFKEKVERLYNCKKEPHLLIKTTRIKQSRPDAKSSAPAIADPPSSKPGTPEGPLKVQNITASDCQLDWKAPTNSQYLPVRYEIYKKTNSDSNWGVAIAIIENPPYIVNNLMPATAYHFKVIAFNDWGKSDALETSNCIYTMGKPGIPEGPLELKNITATECQLKWKPPTNSKCVLVQFYRVYKKKVGDSNWDKAIEDVEKTSCVVKNLMPATNYHFNVTAVNKWGESEELKTLESIRTKGILPPPEGPLNAENTEDNNCRLTWRRPVTSKEQFKHYEVIIQYAIGDSWNNADCQVPVTDTSCIVEGLFSYTIYRFQVIAVYYKGSGEEKSDPIETTLRTDGPYKMHEDRYEDIRTAFYDSVDSSKYKIIKIERITNKTLRDQYNCVAEEIRDRNGLTDVSQIEKNLWHGMSVRKTNLGLQPIVSINTKGFNRSYSGLSNGAVYGDGVYFAVKASTSLKYATPDESGRSYVYYCDVLTGSFTNGKVGLKTAPYKDNSASDIYDSVVDNISSPSMFVIFRDNQAFPAYLITFQ